MNGKSMYAIWRKYKGWILLALAAIWRLMYLGRADLWGDEILYLRRSSPPLDVLDIIKSHLEVFPSMPYLPLPSVFQNIILWIEKIFIEDVAHSGFAQRLPSALCGAVTVPLTYWLIRRLSSRRVALLTCLMQCFLFFPLYYSREARFYAPLLCLVTSVQLLYFYILQKRKLSIALGTGLFLVAAATCHITLNGVLYVGSLLGISGLSYMFAWRPGAVDKKAWRKLHLQVGLILVAAIATFAPFLFLYLTKGMGLGTQPLPGVHVLLRDVFGRMLMGSSLPGFLLSIALLAAGLFFILTVMRMQYYRIAYLICTAVVFGITLYKTVSSEYYFARLFYGLTVGIYWIAATGLEGIVFRLPKGSFLSSRVRILIYRIAACFLVGVHAVLLAPLLWSLTAKSKDFGAIARTLNEIMPPGLPYVIESPYEIHFVAQHYGTPNLLPVCPYVMGKGLSELLKLHQRQRAFFEQFPETYFVHCAHPDPRWTWPENYFKQSVLLENKALKKLTRWGIVAPYFISDPFNYEVFIYHNTPEDVKELRRAAGKAVYYDFSSWGYVGYAKYAYARMASFPTGRIELTNLTTNELQGRFAMQIAVAGAQGNIPLQISYNRETLATYTITGGQFGAIKTPVVALSTTPSELSISLPSRPEFKSAGILLINIWFEADNQP